jgi:hypothetical protein
MWTFNPLFAGPDTGEVAQQDKQPRSNGQPASNPCIPPPEALLPALPDKPKALDPGQTLSNKPLQNLPESHHFDKIPIDTSPQRSQAESNAMRETSVSEVKGGERSTGSRGAEIRAAEALGEMNLNQGPEMPAEETPQKEEMEFPALEGSPPPVSPVGTSEDDGNGNGAAEVSIRCIAMRLADTTDLRSGWSAHLQVTFEIIRGAHFCGSWSIGEWIRWSS